MVLDGTDNFETRYLINDFAVTTISRGFISRSQLCGHHYGRQRETARLACIFPDSPRGLVETCDTWAS